MEQLIELSNFIGEDAKWYSYFGKTVLQFLITLNISAPSFPTTSLSKWLHLVYIWKETLIQSTFDLEELEHASFYPIFYLDILIILNLISV